MGLSSKHQRECISGTTIDSFRRLIRVILERALAMAATGVVYTKVIVMRDWTPLVADVQLIQLAGDIQQWVRNRNAFGLQYLYSSRPKDGGAFTFKGQSVMVKQITRFVIKLGNCNATYSNFRVMVSEGFLQYRIFIQIFLHFIPRCRYLNA